MHCVKLCSLSYKLQNGKKTLSKKAAEETLLEEHCERNSREVAANKLGGQDLRFILRYTEEKAPLFSSLFSAARPSNSKNAFQERKKFSLSLSFFSFGKKCLKGGSEF